MRKILALGLLCAAPLVSVAETPASLDSLKAGGLPHFSIEQARKIPAPAGVAGVSSSPDGGTVRAAVGHISIANMEAGAAASHGIQDYQIGDEWGKKPVSASSLSRESAVFQRAAKATARYGGGTAFYLGVFNGRHLMATNHHVIQHMGCQYSAEFVLMGRAFPCEKIFGDWKEIDLGIFSITVGQEDEAGLAGNGRNFAFDAAIYPGQELLTIGFGVAGNPRRVMMANQDSDCRVFSDRNDFRQMADPDDFNPGPDRVWSFANGCDISHGDSGSAYVDRKSGDVLGIVWTGRIPKSPQVASSKYLAEMQRTRSAEIWTELSYTVPAAKIRDGINAALSSGAVGPEEAATLRAVVQ